MLTALSAGTTDASVLADLAREKLRAKPPPLREPLTGRFCGHHATLARSILSSAACHVIGMNRAVTEVLRT
jgi:hypothetical protein